MPPSPSVQLSLLSPKTNGKRNHAVTGCWSAGERYLALGKERAWVNVWFHFLDGEVAILSLRYRDLPPRRVHGRWWIEMDQLVVAFGESKISAAYHLHEEVLEWAGETLLLLPDQMASLPFGIKLPYHLATSAIPAPDFLVNPFAPRPATIDTVPWVTGH